MNKKKLLQNYETAKGKNPDTVRFYSFNEYIKDLQRLKKDIKDGKIVLHIDPSRSGMSRKMNFLNNYNMCLNITYNQKASFDPVSVGGCGMDMVWHLLFTTLQIAWPNLEKSPHHYNSLCSRVTTL